METRFTGNAARSASITDEIRGHSGCELKRHGRSPPTHLNGTTETLILISEIDTQRQLGILDIQVRNKPTPRWPIC